MNSAWFKFEPVRLSKNRAHLLSLIGNEESALTEIEGALSRYFALAPDGKRGPEPTKKVRDDLKRLADAIATLNEILQPQSRGQARSLFVDACAEYVEDGTLARLRNLEGVLRGDGGDSLVEAAQTALASLDVTSGRLPSPEKAGRVYLVKAIASAVEKVGLKPGRNKWFIGLVQNIYASAGIENADGEIIEADGDEADGDIRAAGF